MTLTTGTTVNIGPKGSNNRAHRITHIETTTHGNRKITLVRINDETTWTTTIKPTANRVTWNARMNRVITDAEREQSIEQEALKIIHHEGEIDSTRINHSTLYRLSTKGLVYVSRHYPNGTYDVALTTHGRDLIDTDQTDNSAQDSETITLEALAAEYPYTVEELAALLGDSSLTAHDGVDAEAARRLISPHMLVPGQIWESKRYGTDHTVTEHVGDDVWEITGPTGSVYHTTPQTFRALNRLTDRTQVR